MKASQYNVRTKYEATGETLLFNTLTTALLALDTNTAVRVEELLNEPNRADQNGDLATYLLSRGFLVADNVDEFAIISERSTLGINDTNRLDVIAMPNMNCNLACTYCYEEHHKSAMSGETAANLLSWFQHMIPRFKVVLLSWFGGEPLLSYKSVIQIQQQVRDMANAAGTGFLSHMTTNGYALSPERAATLVSLGLHSYQITLDGVPETHNAMRPHRGGGGTFERIMANVCALVRTSSQVSVKLRVNYDERNLNDIPALLGLFPEDVRDQLDVVFERIFGQEYSNYEDAMQDREVGVKVESLYQHAKNHGFPVSMNALEADRLNYCYADRKNQFVFNYNGDVFKCTVDKFESKDRLGRLTNEGMVSWEGAGERRDQWHAIPVFEDKCHTCTYAPLCMGGCRKVRGRLGTVGDSCKLPFAGFDKRLHYYYANQRGDNIRQQPPLQKLENGNRTYPVWKFKEVRE